METPLNQEVERIIRESLAETKSWGWSDEDRRLSACGSALKWLDVHSSLEHSVCIAVAETMVKQIMAEEEPLQRYCAHCGGYHPMSDLDAGWHCPMERDPQ